MPPRAVAIALIVVVVEVLPACAGPNASLRVAEDPSPAEVQRAVHALGRLGFGARPGEAEEVARFGIERWIAVQLHPERIDEGALSRRLLAFPTLDLGPEDLARRFPPGPVVRAVSRGELAAPGDPDGRAIYETQLARRRERTKGHATEDDRGPAASDEILPEEAERLLLLPPEGRVAYVLSLPPEDRLGLLRALRPAERWQVRRGLSPSDREVLVALSAPAQVPAGELADAKLLRAIAGERQLLEVMTDFWEDHFNVFVHKGAIPWLLGAYERDAIRPHALGRFRDLLGATARSPAMLFYLDNWLSVGSRSPRGLRTFGREGLNENYARELLELHTLGAEGGFTQRDVEEVARCFTGWTLQRPFWGGGFTFDPRRHEPGDKVVLGQIIREAGQREGEEVLDLLAQDPRTARRIALRLAVRFVSDDPPSTLVDRLAAAFENSGGDIRTVLLTLFGDPTFWATPVRGAKLKTPLELVASAVRASGAAVEEPEALVETLRKMGMAPYSMPTPNGYSWRADAWSGAGALAQRTAFALRLCRGEIPGVQVDSVALAGGASDPAQDLARLERVLLGGVVSPTTHEAVLARVAAARPEERDALAAGLLLASPEFQRR